MCETKFQKHSFEIEEELFLKYALEYYENTYNIPLLEPSLKTPKLAH